MTILSKPRYHHCDEQQPSGIPCSGSGPVRSQEELVKVYCEANPNYHLANVFHGQVAMVPANESDPNQQWIMVLYPYDEPRFCAFALVNKATGQPLMVEYADKGQWTIDTSSRMEVKNEAGLRAFTFTNATIGQASRKCSMDASSRMQVKDEAGFSAIDFVSKTTGHAPRHGRADKERVTLGPYNSPDEFNDAVLFKMSVGWGYQYIMPVNSWTLNLDAKVEDEIEDDQHHGGLRERAEVDLCKRNNQNNQKWKIRPIMSSSEEGYGTDSLYHELNEEKPQGPAFRIYCEADPVFSVAARDHNPVLAPESPHDPLQQWIKVRSWVGFPAFSLVNLATNQALKHGDQEGDQIYLAEYSHNKLDESFLWTLSADVGNGYQFLRPVNNIHLHLGAKEADGEAGGICDGNELILFSWKKQSNQKWKLEPINYLF